MALKNRPLLESEKTKINIISETSKKKIDKKIDEIENIYLGDIAISRANEQRFSSKDVRKEFGL